MKKILTLVLSLFAFTALVAQTEEMQLPINSKTVFKDGEGNLISFETFIEWTSGTGYEINPVFDDANNLKEIIVNKSAIAPPSTDPKNFANTTEIINRVPPDFEVVDRSGSFYSLSNLRGKVIVLKFWFAACQPCIKEMPELNTLVQNYSSRSDVVFLAPSLDNPETINRFLETRPFQYKIIPDATDFAHNYNVPGYPTHVVINRSGKVETVFMGVNYNIKDKLTGAIERALLRPIAEEAPTVDTAPKEEAIVPKEEEEVFITPNSVIKNVEGELVPFGKFAELMNSNRYELVNETDKEGNAYILMREVKQ